jgi:hypothetical protein
MPSFKLKLTIYIVECCCIWVDDSLVNPVVAVVSPWSTTIVAAQR